MSAKPAARGKSSGMTIVAECRRSQRDADDWVNHAQEYHVRRHGPEIVQPLRQRVFEIRQSDCADGREVSRRLHRKDDVCLRHGIYSEHLLSLDLPQALPRLIRRRCCARRSRAERSAPRSRPGRSKSSVARTGDEVAMLADQPVGAADVGFATRYASQVEDRLHALTSQLCVMYSRMAVASIVTSAT